MFYVLDMQDNVIYEGAGDMNNATGGDVYAVVKKKTAPVVSDVYAEVKPKKGKGSNIIIYF